MTKNDIHILLNFLDELFPYAKCELKHQKDYELVIAVMLSAKTTDASVNQVTSILFKKYQSLDELANADIQDIENICHRLGLYKNKANNIILIAQKLIDCFNYKVPSDKTLLQTLPGVGNKTAGVIRAEIFNIPDLPVDTHILRISMRLKIANKDDKPIDVEMKLKKLISQDCWIKSHHQLIHFGRYFCTAKKPMCEKCKLREFCSKY